MVLSHSGRQRTGKGNVKGDSRQCTIHLVSAEREELRKSGLCREFARIKQGRWNHSDWVAFLRELRAAGYRSLQDSEIGLELEEAKAEIWRPYLESRKSFVNRNRGNWNHSGWLEFFDEVRKAGYGFLTDHEVAKDLEGDKSKYWSERVDLQSLCRDFLKTKEGRWNPSDWLEFLATVRKGGIEFLTDAEVGLNLEECRFDYSRYDRENRGVVISYMREDEDSARAILRDLKENGIRAWMDKESTDGGEMWRRAFSEQLSASRCCISIFSKHYTGDPGRAFSQELNLALQHLREDHTFKLVPLRLEECNIPSLPIGNGFAIADLHWIDLFGPHAEDALVSLLTTLGAARPTVYFAAMAELRVRRLDDRQPGVELIADGREVCRIKANDEVVVHLPAATVRLYARVYAEYPQRASYSSYDEYEFGRSEKISVQLKPFGKYVVRIDASSLHHYTFFIFSPLTLLGRRLLGFERKVWYSDEDTWGATIRLWLDRTYPQ